MLTVRVPAPPSGCPGDPVGPPKPVVVTAPGAVAVGSEPDLSSVVPGSPDDTCARPAVLRFVPITVTLDQPLGNRVLVDASGNPIAVVPE
jgi:hypothetical protein